MIFCTYNNFIHEYSKEFVLNQTSFTKCLLLPTITNKYISTKLCQIIIFLYHQRATDSLIDNKDQKITVSEIGILL